MLLEQEVLRRRGEYIRRFVTILTVQDMDTQDEIFKAIEEYKGMTIQALTYSKIGKGKSYFWRGSERGSSFRKS
jgi:hypothetical protein